MPSRRSLAIRQQIKDLWLKEFNHSDIAQAVNVSTRTVRAHVRVLKEEFARWSAVHEQEAFRRQIEAVNVALREAWITYHNANDGDVNGKVGALNCIARLLTQRGDMLGLNTTPNKVDASVLYATLQRQIQDEIGYGDIQA